MEWWQLVLLLAGGLLGFYVVMWAIWFGFLMFMFKKFDK